jgi:cytochrome c
MPCRPVDCIVLLSKAAVLVAAALSAACDSNHADTRGLGAGVDSERGRKLLSQYQCGACHTIPGVPSSRGRVAAPLTGFGQRSYIAGRLPNRADVLAQWIAQPQALVPGTAMPNMGVPPEDARHMAAYLMEQR